MNFLINVTLKGFPPRDCLTEKSLKHEFDSGENMRRNLHKVRHLQTTSGRTKIGDIYSWLD